MSSAFLASKETRSRIESGLHDSLERLRKDQKDEQGSAKQSTPAPSTSAAGASAAAAPNSLKKPETSNTTNLTSDVTVSAEKSARQSSPSKQQQITAQKPLTKSEAIQIQQEDSDDMDISSDEDDAQRSNVKTATAAHETKETPIISSQPDEKPETAASISSILKGDAHSEVEGKEDKFTTETSTTDAMDVDDDGEQKTSKVPPKDVETGLSDQMEEPMVTGVDKPESNEIEIKDSSDGSKTTDLPDSVSKETETKTSTEEPMVIEAAHQEPAISATESPPHAPTMDTKVPAKTTPSKRSSPEPETTHATDVIQPSPVSAMHAEQSKRRRTRSAEQSKVVTEDTHSLKSLPKEESSHLKRSASSQRSFVGSSDKEPSQDDLEKAKTSTSSSISSSVAASPHLSAAARRSRRASDKPQTLIESEAEIKEGNVAPIVYPVGKLLAAFVDVKDEETGLMKKACYQVTVKSYNARFHVSIRASFCTKLQGR
jgi:hypothetical protein